MHSARGVKCKVLNQHLQLLLREGKLPLSKWPCSQVEVNRGQEGMDRGNRDPDSIKSQVLLVDELVGGNSIFRETDPTVFIQQWESLCALV